MMNMRLDGKDNYQMEGWMLLKLSTESLTGTPLMYVFD